MIEITIEARNTAINKGVKVKRIRALPLAQNGASIHIYGPSWTGRGCATGSSLDVLPHPHIGLSAASQMTSTKKPLVYNGL
jgi:hypothetical protein